MSVSFFSRDQYKYANGMNKTPKTRIYPNGKSTWENTPVRQLEIQFVKYINSNTPSWFQPVGIFIPGTKYNNETRSKAKIPYLYLSFLQGRKRKTAGKRAKNINDMSVNSPF